MADPRIRQLKIKTGIVKRLYKEKISYEKEAEQLKENVQKLQKEGKEIYYVKKADELLQETLNVIPDCQKRLDAGYADLKNFVENEAELKEVEEYQSAKSMLGEALPYITA